MVFLVVVEVEVEVEEGEGEMAEERGLEEEAGVRGLEVRRPAAEEEEVGDLTVEVGVGLEGVLAVAVDFFAE